MTAREKLDSILLNKQLNAVTKVYRIAKELEKENQINTQLLYAILELKDENIKDIMFEDAKE